MKLFRAIKRRVVFFLVNKIYVGTRCFKRKRKLLNSIGFSIGEGTKVVGPIICTGKLSVGKDTWIGKNFAVNGNGTVVIGDRCDIAPDVTFMTGGHEIGGSERRAGKGQHFSQAVGNGVWVGGRVTIFNNVTIGDSCVIAGGACVVHDVLDNSLVGGVPAKIIRELKCDDRVTN